MKYTIQLPEYHISITYRGKDGYSAKRCAILLAEQLEAAGERTEVLCGACIDLKLDTAVSPLYSIDVCGTQIDVSACGVLAYEAILRYFANLTERGIAPYSKQGNAAEEHEDRASQYAFSRQGDHRVMFYNLLWSNEKIYEPHQRAIMSIELVREFAPDVVGFQESNLRKRSQLGNCSIELLLDAIGYKEVPVGEIENSYKNSNSTPLFYNSQTVECLDCAYVWYRDQQDGIGVMDRSSKSMTWGLFEVKATGERYIAASTHMCTRDDSIRALQAAEACELFDALHEKYGVPVIVGGDYNSTSASQGYLYYHDVAKHPDAYEHATVYACDTASHHPYPKRDPKTGLIMPTEGAKFHMPEKAIDHIFCPYLDPSDIRVFGVAVNAYSLAASDHLPVYIDFSISATRKENEK